MDEYPFVAMGLIFSASAGIIIFGFWFFARFMRGLIDIFKATPFIVEIITRIQKKNPMIMEADVKKYDEHAINKTDSNK